jgi:hypothetical protein
MWFRLVGVRLDNATETYPAGDEVQTVERWTPRQNTGRTPAIRMRAAFEGHILPRGTVPEVPDISTQPAKALFPGIPDFYYPFGKSRILKNNEFEQIRDGYQVAWIIGRVDSFDNQQRLHHTDIRTRWDQPRGAFVPNEEGNDAD